MGDLGNIAISLGVAVIVVGVVASVLTSLQGNVDSSVNVSDPGTFNVAYNSTASGIASINTLASYLPLVALAAVGAVVIGIIVKFFLNRNN